MNRIYYTEMGQYMLAQGLTVEGVSKLCNVERKTVYNWINKKTKPTNVTTFIKLSKALNVDVLTLKKYFGD